MKKLKLWLRELSLLQQLLTIVCVVITVFSIFLMVFLADSINEFVKIQMFSILDKIQPTIAYAYNEAPIQLKEYMKQDDLTLTHIVFKDNQIIMQNNGSEVYKNTFSMIIQEASGALHVNKKGVYTEGKQIYYYSAVELKGGAYLLSIVSDMYRIEFKNAILNSVVNYNMVVVGMLFIMLMLWISSLIHPLNQIRAYVMKIKNGEDAQLKINRKDEIGEVADVLVAMQKELSHQNKRRQISIIKK